MDSEGIIECSIDKYEMKIENTDERAGYGQERLEGEMSGEPVSIRLTGSYLLDYLRVIEGEKNHYIPQRPERGGNV